MGAYTNFQNVLSPPHTFDTLFPGRCNQVNASRAYQTEHVISRRIGDQNYCYSLHQKSKKPFGRDVFNKSGERRAPRFAQMALHSFQIGHMRGSLLFYVSWHELPPTRKCKKHIFFSSKVQIVLRPRKRFILS